MQTLITKLLCLNTETRPTSSGIIYVVVCIKQFLNQSINQSINTFITRHSTEARADYAETKRNVLSRVLNVSTDGAVRQFRGREFQSITVVSLDISGRKFPEFYSNLSGNIRKFVNSVCQSAVFKSSIAK